MIKYFLFFTLLCSCSTIKVSSLETLKSIPGYKEKIIPVQSRIEAKKIINNKINFTKMIFEQSTDPYFGTPRWSDYCSKLNAIGSPTETTNGIQSISTLVLNANDEPGYCNDAITQSHNWVLYVYCEGSNKVIEIIYPYLAGSVSPKGDLCAN